MSSADPFPTEIPVELREQIEASAAVAAMLNMRWFTYDHLPPHLAAISRPFAELAELMVDTLPADPEVAAGLRHLLAAKDCMVRAATLDAPARGGADITDRTG